MKRTVRTLRLLLLGLAGFCLGYWSFATLHARVVGARESARLDALIRQQGERGDDGWPAGRPGPAGDGALLGRLEIPRLGISAVVLEGTSERSLAVAAGHVAGTALPGTDGNTAIAGHRDSIFRALRHVRLDDTVVLTTPRRRRTYAVEGLEVVDPADTRVLRPTPDAWLTLITCYPFGYIGPAPQRFVVLARERAPGHTSPRPASAVSQAGGQAPHRPEHAARRSRPERAPARLAARAGAVAPASRAPAPAQKREPWWRRLFHHHRIAPAQQ